MPKKHTHTHKTCMPRETYRSSSFVVLHTLTHTHAVNPRSCWQRSSCVASCPAGVLSSRLCHQGIVDLARSPARSRLLLLPPQSPSRFSSPLSKSAPLLQLHQRLCRAYRESQVGPPHPRGQFAGSQLPSREGFQEKSRPNNNNKHNEGERRYKQAGAAPA